MSEKYYQPEEFIECKENLVKAMFDDEVEWVDPNKQCKHCGRYFDPSYEFIEDEDLLAFCMDGNDEYKYPDYCPECIQDLYDFCNDAESAFKERDKIK